MIASMWSHMEGHPCTSGEEPAGRRFRQRPTSHARRSRIALFFLGSVVIFMTAAALPSGCRKSDEPSPEEFEEVLRSGDTRQLTKWLDDHPQLAKLRLDRSVTPLHLAAQQRDPTMTRLLLARGADIEACDNRSRTPLQNAALHGRTNAVTALLEAGASLSHRDREGHQALHFAVQSGHTTTCTLLIKRGADVNSRLTQGTTPLHAAVIQSYRDIVELLLEAGADPNAKADDGTTPLGIATAQAKPRIADLLVRYGAK